MGTDVCPTVLWAPSTPIPGEHDKTTHLPLGINSVVGRRHLPYMTNTIEPTTCVCASTVLWAPIIILYLMAWAIRLSSICTLSLSLVRPSPSSIKRDVLSPNKDNSTTRIDTRSIHRVEQPTIRTIPTEHTLKYLAHIGAPVSLSPSVQSLTGPLAPPSYSLSFETPHQTSST